MITLIASLVLTRLQGQMAPQMGPPMMGDKAPAFEVRTLDDKAVRLGSLLRRGPVVLIVLRGYPGYQCPFCTAQVGELVTKGEEFKKRHASLVLVYPGPSDNLKKYAGEFVAGKDIPSSYRFAIDPDFKLVNQYHLRWDAPNETAYPSTFVIERDGKISYAKISHEHGGRPAIAEVLSALDMKR